MNPLPLGALLALVVVPAWSQEPLVDQDKAVEQSQGAEETSEAVETSDDAAPNHESLVPSGEESVSGTTRDEDPDKTEIETQDRLHDLDPFAWTWNWDRVLQAIGIGALLFVIIQTKWALGRAAHANEIAQKVADASIRPWLQIKSEVLSSDMTSRHGGVEIDLIVPVENIGKTPAIRVTVAAKLVPTSEEARTDTLFSDWCDQMIEGRSRYRINDIFPTMTAYIPQDFRLHQFQIEDRVGIIKRPGNLMDARIEYHLFVCATYTSMTDPSKLFVTAHSARARLKDEEDGYETSFFDIGEGIPKETLQFERGQDSRVV